MYPGVHASAHPDKPAVISARTGEALTYGQLEERSVRLANRLRSAGLRPGDHLALLSDNDARCLEVYWAAMRSGLYLTSVNSHLTAEEAAYIVGDCGARALIVSASLTDLANALVPVTPEIELRLSYGRARGGSKGSSRGSSSGSPSGSRRQPDHALRGNGEHPKGYEDYEAALAAASPTAPEHQPRGADMLYSSGTTGRPKGVQPALSGEDITRTPSIYTALFAPLYGFDTETVYLSPAPLYHAAPLRFCGVVTATGGTVVLMDTFDAERSLALIEGYGVTHSQWVPTMFVRMLKLPAQVAQRYALSSLRVAIHAAAPCPTEVKRRMLEWWGPVLYEYYSSTEGNGLTAITPQESLRKPGSVGRSVLGDLRVCGEDGTELPPGATGTVYFAREERPFAYHNDPERTAEAQHPHHPGWTTTGDIGHVDEDGYLFLTDRKAFTIISGGVNIYPQEIENCLTLHPKVADVAVVGVPDAEMGEAVRAVVQPEPEAVPGAELERELLAYVRGRIARYKVPRAVEFTDQLPRTPTGKLAKGTLRERLSAGEPPAARPSERRGP
ncbi:acyl-CoA synthetase [Streptomyces sp. NBC_01187]|uniref:acyl-CoA synthetase n=1 Tax=Streptomyces sp. NBC_01187 TaxID=2903766 RepID=UPI003865EE84|nr:acyl-CoA synthetase [Streptomyces sp. NBC_01187]